MKYGETFHGHHTALTPVIMKINRLKSGVLAEAWGQCLRPVRKGGKQHLRIPTKVRDKKEGFFFFFFFFVYNLQYN